MSSTELIIKKILGTELRKADYEYIGKYSNGSVYMSSFWHTPSTAINKVIRELVKKYYPNITWSDAYRDNLPCTFNMKVEELIKENSKEKGEFTLHIDEYMIGFEYGELGFDDTYSIVIYFNLNP